MKCFANNCSYTATSAESWTNSVHIKRVALAQIFLYIHDLHPFYGIFFIFYLFCSLLMRCHQRVRATSGPEMSYGRPNPNRTGRNDCDVTPVCGLTQCFTLQSNFGCMAAWSRVDVGEQHLAFIVYSVRCMYKCTLGPYQRHWNRFGNRCLHKICT